MKPEIKQLWLDALRSGKYQQGTGTLRKQDNFCCLGVLCDLYQKETGEGEWVKDAPDGIHSIYGSTGILPARVRNWAGFGSHEDSPYISRTDAGSLLPEYVNRGASIAQLNDDGMSFEKLADIIEKVL